MFLTLTVTVKGNAETYQSRQNQAQGCPQVFGVILTKDMSLARLGTNPDTNHNACPLSRLREVLRGFTSTLFKVEELKCGREAQKTHAGRGLSLQHIMGLAGTGITLHFSWKDRGGQQERGRERGQLPSLLNILLCYFLYREWTISKCLIIQKHMSDLAKAKHMDNVTSGVVTLAGQKYLYFLIFHLLNESLQTWNRATLSLI